MALHRDIFWIGRQWAVTGAGIQAIDQRLKGAFDIDRAKVWDDGLLTSLHELPWFNAADFDNALGVARGRFPPAEQASRAAPTRVVDRQGDAAEPRSRFSSAREGSWRASCRNGGSGVDRLI